MAHATALWNWDDDPALLGAALTRGGVLGIPTESSYGLAVDPLDARGVDALFRLKGRAGDQALPVVLADLEQAWALGVDRAAPGLRAIAALWPAAVTLVVPLERPIAASAGVATLAIRVPEHARLRALLARLGPLTATSANRAGEPPLLHPRAVAELVTTTGGLAIDDGSLPGGLPSTLVRWEAGVFRVLRAGRFAKERLPSEAS